MHDRGGFLPGQQTARTFSLIIHYMVNPIIQLSQTRHFRGVRFAPLPRHTLPIVHVTPMVELKLPSHRRIGQVKKPIILKFDALFEI